MSPLKYRVAAWIAVIAAACMVVSVEQVRDGARDARAQQRLKQEVSKWQAKYAEESVRARTTADTVVRVVHQTELRRDTLNIHDTVQVQAFVRQVDTVLVQCRRCAARLDSLRTAADGTIKSLDTERAWWQQHAETIQRRRDLASKFLPFAFIGGVALGAWVRGSAK